MARIVLTGGKGLLGQEVARRLSARGDDVLCLARGGGDVAGVEYLNVDLNLPLPVERLPRHADAVIHLAQSERFNDFPDGADSVFAVNVAAPAALFRWAQSSGVQSFVHASSGGLYGGGPKPFAETDALNMTGRLAYYLSTKRAVELMGEAYQPHFAVAALRFFFIYGAGQRANMLMPRLVSSVREGRPLTLQGQNGMSINPVHVSDAANAVIAAVERKERGVFNIAGPETVSIRALGEIIGRILGRPATMEAQSAAHANDLVADINAMRTRLHAPLIGPSQGLLEMSA